MKVTVIVDNCVPPSIRGPFIGEHGLALLIEQDGKRLLFDTGQSDAVVHNLGLLGVHPSSLDGIIISHGHYDHTGGLMAVLQHAAKTMPVYAHPDIFQTRVSVAGKRHFIGIPFTQPQLTELGAQWNFYDRPLELLPGLWYSGRIERSTDYELGDAKLLTCPTDGCCVEDPLQDDIALFCATGQGLRVIGGCTHAGIINTIRYGFSVTGQLRLHTWIGGTHLGPVTANQQNKTLDALEEMRPELIAANHCTGFAMMAVLSTRFGERFIPAFVGTALEW